MRAMLRATSGPMRYAAVATGILMGIALGLLLNDPPSAAIAVALAVLVALVPPVFAAREDWPRLQALLLGALALRMAVAVVLYTASDAMGRGGFVTGDDGVYASLSHAYLRHLLGDPIPAYGPPVWRGDAYLLGTFVYLEAFVFWLVGPRVVVMELLNGAFAAVTLGLVFSFARMLYGRRAAWTAALLIAFFPSLVLWSALNLKDSLALLLIAGVLWSVVHLHATRDWRWLVLAFLLLWPMETLRRYIFFGLAVLIPASTWLTPNLRPAERLRWGISATTVAALVLLANQASSAIGPGTFLTLEAQRNAAALNARTAFVPATPIAVADGDTFVVPGGKQGPSPSLVIVPPGSVVVVEGASATRRPPPRPFETPVVVLQPGDVVVVGGPESQPAPPDQRRVLRADRETQLKSAGTTEENVAARTLAYLPTGLAYAFLAPFPWSIRRSLDFLTIPEMLVWYMLVALAAYAIWAHRRSWQRVAPVALMAGGVLLVLALVEGNVGTLFRHRAMAIPWVIVIASPQLALILARLRSRVSPVRQATPDRVAAT